MLERSLYMTSSALLRTCQTETDTDRERQTKSSGLTSSSCLSKMALIGEGWVAAASSCCSRMRGGSGPSGDRSPTSGDDTAASSVREQDKTRHVPDHSLPPISHLRLHLTSTYTRLGLVCVYVLASYDIGKLYSTRCAYKSMANMRQDFKKVSTFGMCYIVHIGKNTCTQRAYRHVQHKCTPCAYRRAVECSACVHRQGAVLRFS